MDGPEPERSSSSRSANIARIEHVKTRRPANEVEITLSDASSFLVPAPVWTESGLSEGTSLTPGQIELIVREGNQYRIRSAAINLLARREHSRRQLVDKLAIRFGEEQLCRAVVDELAERGLQSDVRFAESWARHRIRSHPESRTHLEMNLRSRGVPDSVAREAVESVLVQDDLDERAMIRVLLEKWSYPEKRSPPESWSHRSDGSAKGREARLARLGFRRSDVENELNRLAEQEGLENNG